MTRLVSSGRKLLFRLTAAILVLDVVVTLGSLAALSRNVRCINLAREVLGEFQGTLAALKEAEARQLAFLCTGDGIEIDAHFRAVPEIGSHLAVLERLTEADPVQRARVAGLRHVIAGEIEGMEGVNRLRREVGAGPAIEHYRSAKARRSRLEYIRLASEIGREEGWKLAEATRTSQEAIDRTLMAFLLAAVLALTLLRLVVASSRREADRREQAAAAIRQSERWLTATLRGIGDAVIATDEQGKVRFINPVAQRLTGWGQDEARGRSLREVFPIVDEATRRAVDNPVDRVLESGEVVGVSNHTLLIPRDGPRRPIDHNGSPIRREDGSVAGVVLCFRDATDRLGAEEARGRLAAIVESSGDAIIGEDGDGMIVSWNDGARRIFGYDAGEVLGRPSALLIPADRGEEMVPALEVLRRGGRVLDLETARLRKGGPPIEVSLTISPIMGPSGEAVGASTIARDITDRRRSERRWLAAKEAADAANRAKDQFLAVLSHELRTPLTPVLLAVTSRLEVEPDPETRETLEMIRRNIELESRLIDDLLDISRIVRGDLRLELELVDVHEAIGRAVEMCSAEVAATGLVVALDLAATTRHTVVDRARLMQVLNNLLRNATKFAPGGGLTIRTSDGASPPGVVSGRRLVVEFQDSGIGIEPELLPRMFEPFEQGARESRKRSGGMGLGLAISRSIVVAQGGTLSASSPGRGRGATLRVELMAVRSPDSPPVALAAPPAPIGSGGLRILLVEDNQDALRFLCLALGRHGHVVRAAERLGAAREALAAGDFDLLISDIELPDGTGLELMREVARGPGTPGIAMSGFGSEEDIRESREAGFAEHLTKPVELRALAEVIRRVVPGPGRRPVPGDLAEPVFTPNPAEA